MSLFDFDASDIDTTDFLPEGWYRVKVSEAELLPTKSGGERLKLTYKVFSGTGTGRNVFGSINTKHANPTVVEIGKKELARLLKAMGLERVKSTNELLNKPLEIKVSVKEDDYGIKNEVRGYRAAEGVVAPAVALEMAKAAPKKAVTKPAPKEIEEDDSDVAPWA
jgi:Protein of unknown function (DUF669)